MVYYNTILHHTICICLKPLLKLFDIYICFRIQIRLTLCMDMHRVTLVFIFVRYILSMMQMKKDVAKHAYMAIAVQYFE